ncbi:hypothetical protein NC653_012642 [Populus alba x Populus x berolinensis]|uniref:Uncharacterized protein n=1 Tax=Populus alba x Populus x berolinensis TaxID=444605 RepID=A0AAD6QSI1_9ROSI|nr:hypothetical protein NC653_012642 [Populus alba x Populus x berolinensis]
MSNSYMEIISVLLPPSCSSLFRIAFIAAGSNISSIRDAQSITSTFSVATSDKFALAYIRNQPIRNKSDDVNLSQDCSLDSSLQQLAQLTAPFRFRYMGSGVSGSRPEVRPLQNFQIIGWPREGFLGEYGDV